MSGYFRDGFANTDDTDHGKHIICVVMTAEFLAYSAQEDNDLSTPKPQWNFPGLKTGDKWCLCISRFVDAVRDSMAPKVILESSHIECLDHITLEELKKHEWVPPKVIAPDPEEETFLEQWVDSELG